MNEQMRISESVDLTDSAQRECIDAEYALEPGPQLIALRQLRGLKQSDVAARMGKHQQSVPALENPLHVPSLRTLRDLARALDAFVDVVLVPREKHDLYQQVRYQPTFDAEPPSPALFAATPTAIITSGHSTGTDLSMTERNV